MNAWYRTVGVFSLLAIFLIQNAAAQGNIDWEEAWKQMPPFGPTPHPMAWMNDSLSYTRLAYDETRDVLYVVSPHPAGGAGWSAPAIHILDRQTGQPRMDMGRSAHFARQGLGGELPVPLDTFITVNNKNLGFGDNWFALYSIDVDEEGRIYACNLVTPVWGICNLLPQGGCDPMYLGQGPFRVWRWDTPTSTPELIYATCNTSHTAIGNINSSEMAYARWGDTFSVTGKRAWYHPPHGGPPVLVDSTRIYVSGGASPGSANGRIAVLLPDDRPAPLRPTRDVMGGGNLSFRLGLQINLPANFFANGLAPDLLTVSGDTLERWIWLQKYGQNVMKVRERQLPGAPLPQTLTPAGGDVLIYPGSSSLFGASGAMEFMHLPQWQRSFLAVADGRPTGGSIVSIANDNTTARFIDVTDWRAAFMFWGETPQLGQANQWSIEPDNYISDVDMTLFYDSVHPGPYPRLQMFVLMTNNGIASYRSRPQFPVELLSLRAHRTASGAEIEWTVAEEVNIQQYQVERGGTENGPWAVVGTVAARGGTGNLSYAIDDENAEWNAGPAGDKEPSGGIWYRLTALQYDGSKRIFPPVMVEHTAQLLPLQCALFPQPVSSQDGMVYLRLQSPAAEDVSLRVVDLLGQEVQPARQYTVGAGRTLLPLRIGDVTSGIYLIVLRTGSGAVRTQRMIVR